MENYKKVEYHNSAGEYSYELEMNGFADMTHKEFAEIYLIQLGRPGVKGCSKWVEPKNATVPDTVDWREKGVVTPIKNQGQCGSCWAFSTTGSLEGQHAIVTGKLVSLSEQELVDCSGKFGNEGCNGGEMEWAYDFIISRGSKGLCTEDSYPYKAHDEKCREDTCTTGATCTGCVTLPSKNETALKIAVGSIGPISVGIDASEEAFQLYKKGVYDPKHCSKTQLDHGVLAVGYGTEDGKDYWLVKNSWGTDWGMKGYIMMARNKHDECGIATDASYPTGVGKA